MKKDIKPDGSVVSTKHNTEKITRKEALRKAGKFAALTVATMTLLETKASAQTSAPQSPGTGW